MSVAKTQPRLRMFAGPNGSGKTTIKNSLNKSSDWFGIYINPDEIEKSIREVGCFDLRSWSHIVQFELHQLREYFQQSKLLGSHQLADDAVRSLNYSQGRLSFSDLAFNSYHASVLADFLRRQALRNMVSISFETVMSSPDKIELLREALNLGYRTNLYFVATDNVEINICRVKNRVADGGHDVPDDKVRSRYLRSLALLPQALELSTRAYLFDTSQEQSVWIAELKDHQLELRIDEIPNWFQPTWELFARREASLDDIGEQ